MGVTPRALRDQNDRPLQSRIGIATGLVVIGNLHDDDAPDVLDVAGEPPNLAARLQGIAEAGGIVVAPETRKRVGELFTWRDLGELSLKGYRDAVRAWAVVEARPAASRYDAQHESGMAPMLGREELRIGLFEHWREACEGKGRVVLIRGEAGVGKSRLAAAVLEAPGERYTLRYYSSPLRQGSPLHPCVQQLEWASGIAREDSPQTRLDKLDASLGDTPGEDKGLLAELLNLPAAARFAVPELSPQVKRRRTLESLLAQLERLARLRPILVVFEDAQWSDLSTLELLELAVERVSRLPVLLLVLARPEFEPQWAALAQVFRMTLAPLESADAAQLVEWVADGAALSQQTIASIVDRTDGIPLYIEEITRAVVEDQELRKFGSSPQPGGSFLPMWLQASLLSRLDRLGASREVAEIASAIGRHFSADLLTLVVSQPERLEASLEALIAAGIVQRLAGRPSEFTFRHALIRDAAYRIMVKERRLAIHGRIVTAIEASFPEVVAQHPDILALHCAEAGLARQAALYWLKAGHAALRRSAMQEALIHLRHGIEVLPKDESEDGRTQLELDLTIALGKAQIATQGYAIPSTGETFARAGQLCAQLGTPPQTLAVLHGLWTHSLMRAELDSARQQARALLQGGEQGGNRMQLLMGNRFCGVTSHPLGEFAEATRLLEAGLELYDPLQQAIYWALTVDDPRVIMLTYLSWSQMCLGRVSDARSNSQRAISEARGMAHAYTLAHALVGASFVTMTIAPPQAALQRLDDLRALLADNGIAYYDAVETVLRGWCLAAVGQFEHSRRLLDGGMLAYRATEARLYLSGFLRLAAEAHGWAGRLPTALELIQESLEVMEGTNQRWDEAEIHRVHGVLLRSAGDEQGARQALDRACAVARRQGARLWELRAACDLVELARARGEGKQETAILARAVDAYEPGADTPDLARASALLAQRQAT